MNKKTMYILAVLCVGWAPCNLVAAAGVDAATLKQWQDMNNKMLKMQSEMLQMQKEMSALTEKLLLAQAGSAAISAPVDTLGRTQGQPSSAHAAQGVTVRQNAQAAQGVTVRQETRLAQPSLDLPGGNYTSKDLENMGKGLEQDAARTTLSPEAKADKKEEEEKFRFNGEVRFSYLRDRGGAEDRFNRNDSQLRVRLYARQKLNEDWKVLGMLEGQKHFLDDAHTDLTSSTRLYVEGLTGITTLTAGKFGYLMADGNIYDSDFKGVRASIAAAPWTFTAAAGKTGADGDAALGTASYQGYNYDLTAGIYKFGDDDWGRRSNSILALNGNYYWDHVRVGAMYLVSDDNEDSTGQNGYVLSSRYRTMKTWKPGSWSLYANYYNQPYSTYRNHTMNGLGNRMHGFKGYGVGLDYALAREVALNVEYFKLTDKERNDAARTLWGSVSYYF